MKRSGKGPALAGVALLVSACGGGGGGGGSGEAAAPVGQLKDFFQVYTSYDPDTGEQTQVLVNVADFTQRTDLGPNGGFAAFYAGTINGGVVENYRPHSHYYLQENAWRRVSLRHNGSQAPAQVSSDAVAASCGNPHIIEPIFGNAANAVLLYSKPGLDELCGTADDQYRRIGLSDSATTAAQAGPIGDEFHEFRDASGALTGVLAWETTSQTLRRYNAAMTSATVLGTDAGRVDVLVSSGDAALLAYNNTLRRVTAAGDLGDPLHETTGELNRRSGAADDNFWYFTPGYDVPALYRVALDGTAPAELLWAPEAYGVGVVGETDNSIVLWADLSNGTTQVLLLDKATDGSLTPTPIQTFDSGAWVSALSQRAPLLYSVSENGNITAHRLDADDSLTSRYDSEWVGQQYPVSLPLADLRSPRDVAPIGAFRIDGLTPGSMHGGGTIKHVDAAGDELRTLTEVTEEAWVYGYAVGSVGMGFMVFGLEYYFQLDVLSFDLDDGRIERHTNGTPALDYPYAF